MKIRKAYVKDNLQHYAFQCPGCDMEHVINEGWKFNNDFDSPTFTPSVKVSGHLQGKNFVCHSFITDGKIKFLGDCTHHLANQTVDLIEYE